MKYLCCLLAILMMLAASQPPVSAQISDHDNNLITMNFQDVDISVLAKFISDITGKNFVLDDSVRGKVSIVSPSKVTPEQAYSIFKSVLQLKGFTTVQAGPIIKIEPARSAREQAGLTQSQEPAFTNNDEYVTRMIKLRNIDANSLVSVIQPMISRDGLVAAFPETNTLIITDDAWNVQRLLQIIGSLDAQGLQQAVTVIPLKLAYADDLAPKIDQIMTERAGTSSTYRPGMGVVAPSAQAPSRAFKIVPDERTNSLIVLAGPLQMKQIKELVDELDVHSPNATSRIHVYYLKYAQALEMVSVLDSLLGGGSGPGALSPQTGRGSLGRSSGVMGMGGFGALGSMGGMGMGGMGMGSFGGMGMGTMSGMGGMGMGGMGMGGMGMGGMGMGGMGGGSTGPAAPASASSKGGPGTEFELPVRVTADPATNSLVISAMPQDYATLRQIIYELDIPRRQIFVQGVVAEVSANRERQLGISFQGGTQFGNTLGVANFNFGNLATSLSNPLGLTGLNFGLASGSMCTISTALAAASSALSGFTGASTAGTVPTSISVPCDIALITAIENDSHSNILSAPTLLTTDNEEATIIVGENLPFLAGASATSALSGQIFNSVDRQNVGITLDIVPQITDGGYIKMDVYEEVSAVEASTLNAATNPLGPITTIRSASTTVLVQNHRTTVIGGLLSDEVDYTKSGVPYLSDIPVLGNLFTSTDRTGQKTNLLLFLTPHVVRDREDLRELSLAERQKFLQSLGRRELHNMPMDQIQELYKPSFGLTVPPSAELGAPAGSGGGTSSVGAPAPYAPTPLNTEEINPPPPGTSSSAAPPAPFASAAVPPATTMRSNSTRSGGMLDAVSGLFGTR